MATFKLIAKKNIMPTISIGLQTTHYLYGKIIFLLLLCTFLLFTGCNKSVTKNQMSEGNIEYEIQYTNNSGRSFPVQLLPKTMYLTFNQNFAAYTIEDRVGLFAIKIITDLKSHRHLTLIKVFDKK